MTTFHTYHVRVLVIAEISNFFSSLYPWVPDHSIRKVILLNPHLPPRDYIRNYVLSWSILVDTICPLANLDRLTTFLIPRVVSSLLEKTDRK